MPPNLYRPGFFASYAAAHPRRLFWLFALTHLVLWTVIPTVTSPTRRSM